MLGRLSALVPGADQSEVDVLSENIAEVSRYVPLHSYIHPN
jgi:hypothetical protein